MRSCVSSVSYTHLVKKFQCEDPFESCRFLPFGIPRYKSQASQMLDDAQSLIVVSPFLSDSIVERLGNGPYETTLVTRLNSVTQKAWDSFQHVYVPSEMLLDDELLGDADQQSVAKPVSYTHLKET